MLLFPNAKINLGLRVLEKRPDGFHNIETIFLPIQLYDILEFIEKRKGITTLNITGISLETENSDNLVMKAWQIMNKKFHIPSITIHLHKLIPIGAGLGGGSADAAFMLKGLNEYFNCGCNHDQLKNLAAELGSDCPFFIDNIPSLGTGRGEVLEPLAMSLEEYELFLVKPGIHVSTREAYSGTIPKMPERSLKLLIQNPINEWQQSVINDFELAVCLKHPEIQSIKSRLLELGAVYASMTGSGSAVYGVFKTGEIDNHQASFGDCFVCRGKLFV